MKVASTLLRSTAWSGRQGPCHRVNRQSAAVERRFDLVEAQASKADATFIAISANDFPANFKFRAIRAREDARILQGRIAVRIQNSVAPPSLNEVEASDKK